MSPPLIKYYTGENIWEFKIEVKYTDLKKCHIPTCVSEIQKQYQLRNMSVESALHKINFINKKLQFSVVI